MPRKPRDILDTSAKVRRVLNELEGSENGESDSEITDDYSEDTDSLASDYLPSEDERAMEDSELEETEALYPGFTQTSTEDGEDEPSTMAPSTSTSAADVFGRVNRGKRSRSDCDTRIPSPPPRADMPVHTPHRTPLPVFSSTPAPMGGTGDAGTEADTEVEQSRVVRRRLYASSKQPRGGDGGDSDDSSDEDDPPPRIFFTPRRPVVRGEDAPGPSGVSRQAYQPPAAAAAAAPASATRAGARGQERRAARQLRRAARSRRASGRRPRIIRRRRGQGRGLALQDPLPLPGPIYVDPSWTWDDVEGYQPRQYVFSPTKQPGPTFDLPQEELYPRSYIFRQFMTDTIMDLIVCQTNKYNWYRKAGKIQRPNSLYRNYQLVTRAEMYVFLALIILMGVIKKNAVHKYWTTDPLTCTPGFNRVMSRMRFQTILGNLHFIDSLESHTRNQGKRREDKDPMERIRPVSDYLRRKIQTMFNPYQKMCIDESLCLWRGNISMRQYIPSKRHRYGLKTYVLCDCKTGYVQDVLLYMGSKTEMDEKIPDLKVAGTVVTTLMRPYLNEGRILYTDNWYTSPALSLHLDGLNTGSCGTVRRNRSHLPPLPSTREPDSKIYKQANGILLLSWVDNKEVNLISTLHQPVQEVARRRQRGTGVAIEKPQIVNDYNRNMRLVDKKDQVVASAECARKTMRWYKKYFFHLLDVVMYNSNVILNEVRGGKKETRADFCTELARELIVQYKTAPVRRAPAPTTASSHLRLIERHFATLVPATEHKPKPYRRCHVCSHTTKGPQTRKETRYECSECDVGLCVDPCFITYHTQEHY